MSIVQNEKKNKTKNKQIKSVNKFGKLVCWFARLQGKKKPWAGQVNFALGQVKMYVWYFSLGSLVIVSNQEQNVRLQDEQNTVWSVEKFKIQAYCLDHRQYLEYNYDIP